MSSERLPRSELIDGRYLALQGAGGVAVGWLILVGLLSVDPGGLWTLVRASDMRFTALAMLLATFGATFGVAAFATAVLEIGPCAQRRSGGARFTPSRDRRFPAPRYALPEHRVRPPVPTR